MRNPLSFLLAGLLLARASAEIVTVAHPEENLPTKVTVVWSPLFQAAWDKLNATLGGPAVRVVPPNTLIAKLDSFKWSSTAVMPPLDSWKTWYGPANQIFLDQANSEAAKITRKPAGPFVLPVMNPDTNALFGILDRNVTFLNAFFRSNKIPMVFQSNGTKHHVQFFGVRGELSGEIGGAVRVLAWRPIDGSHAIQIPCREAGETVILYIPPHPQSFATACHWLRAWRSQIEHKKRNLGTWDDPFIHSDDTIQIPYFSLQTRADFSSLLSGNRFYGKNPIPRAISQAQQFTCFELNEKGARVSVEASASDPFAGTPLTVARDFLFDRPFFAFLWRDEAKWPYFGAWIGDESALKIFP